MTGIQLHLALAKKSGCHLIGNEGPFKVLSGEVRDMGEISKVILGIGGGTPLHWEGEAYSSSEA